MSSVQKPKIGAGHGMAMLRSGFKEIGQVLPAFPDSMKVVEEYGLFGNTLPQEVYDQKQSMLQELELNEPEMEMGL